MTPINSQNTAHQGLVILSFIIIYFVWGSTYLANKWVVQDIPPFTLSGIRFTTAGFLLLLYCRLTKVALPSKTQLQNSGVAGLFLFAIGNGAVVWALQFVDSGIAALMVSLQPLVIALMLWSMKGQRPSVNTWIGILLGIIGMYFLIGQPQFIADPKWLMGVGAIMVALLGWGWVSLWMVDADLPDSMFQSAAFQMLFGGLMLLTTGLVFQEYQDFSINRISIKSVYAFIYLIVFGSIAAFTAFNYLIKNVAPTKVVTSTYINPIVALFLGYYLNNEVLRWQSLVATGLLILGVVLINMEKNKKKGVV